MSEIELDRKTNQFNGALITVIGLGMIVATFFADNQIGQVLGFIVSPLITFIGIWMIRTKKVYWSPVAGFTPKENK